MTNLKIADGLSLPLDVVTQAMAIIAKRRAGKSYLMRRFVEQVFKAGQQIVLVDPKGDQWGVRSAANGKDPGLPIVIIGGERGDVPLEAGSGEVIAKLVVEERISVLLDLSLFRKHEVATFMTAFMETLYRLKAREIYRTPLMLVIDEADAIAPQKPQKNELRMLGAADDIVRRGGQRGIGCVLVTQRSAVLNKNVLTQAQILVVLRTIAPQDLKAMKPWIDVHGDEEQGTQLMESLPSLPIGDAWFWSPGWPTTSGIFKRVHVLPIETFDSGASPKPGAKLVEPKNLADIDLDALKGHMAATIEKAKTDDPKVLKLEITRLKAELARKTPAKAGPATKPSAEDTTARRTLETTVKQLRTALETAVKFIVNITAQDFISQGGKIDQDQLQKALASAVAQANKQLETQLDGKRRSLEKWQADGQKLLQGLRQLLDKGVVTVDLTVRHNEPFSVSPGRAAPLYVKRSTPDVQNTHKSSTGQANGSLPPGERAILIACVQHDGCAPEQLSILTGYKRSSRNTYLQRLRAAGLLESTGDYIVATPAGKAAIGDYEPLPVGEALAQYWYSNLPDGEGKILKQLTRHGNPEWIEREALQEASGYKRSSLNTYLQRLGARQLIDTDHGQVRASAALFG